MMCEVGWVVAGGVGVCVDVVHGWCVTCVKVYVCVVMCGVFRP